MQGVFEYLEHRGRRASIFAAFYNVLADKEAPGKSFLWRSASRLPFGRAEVIFFMRTQTLRSGLHNGALLRQGSYEEVFEYLEHRGTRPARFHFRCVP